MKQVDVTPSQQSTSEQQNLSSQEDFVATQPDSSQLVSKSSDAHIHLNLRNQIYMECSAMAKFALAKGKSIPASAIQSIEAFENNQEQKEVDISPLVEAHNALTQIIEPATPQAVLLLTMEKEIKGGFKFLGAVPLVRELMLMAITCLLIFIALMSSPYISGDNLTKDVLAADGIEQVARLIFYIGAAGLGASFAALYKVNEYISKGNYDSDYQASYWIRFLLGIIAGLLLAILISQDSLQGDSMLSKGVIRPLLAILGGFSADLLYTFLNRMVETVKSLFEGSTQSVMDAKALEAKSKLATLEIDNRMKLAQNLIQVQQTIGAETSPDEIKEQLNDILKGLTQSKTGV